MAHDKIKQELPGTRIFRRLINYNVELGIDSDPVGL